MPAGNRASLGRVMRVEGSGEITATLGIRKRKERKKHAGAEVPAGITGTGKPLAAIPQSRLGSSGSAKVAHFLAATDIELPTPRIVLTLEPLVAGFSLGQCPGTRIFHPA